MNNKRKRPKKHKRLLTTILMLILIFCCIFISTMISIWRYGKKDSKQQADVAIVLGASLSSDGVSPVFRERLNHGIWLYQNGYVDKIILTGGLGEGSYQSDAFVAGQYVKDQGVPEGAIILEEESKITQENLINSKKIMDDLGYSTAIIVSDPIHMKRSMLMAKDAGITAYSSPTPTSMYQSRESILPFLARESILYMGYGVYRVFIKLFDL